MMAKAMIAIILPFLAHDVIYELQLDSRLQLVLWRNRVFGARFENCGEIGKIDVALVFHRRKEGISIDRMSGQIK
jgi:hypothetical protein